MRILRLSFFYIIISLSIFQNAFGQSPQYKKGELLIKTDYPIENIIEQHQKINQVKTSLCLEKKIDRSFNIYHLSFDASNIDASQLLSDIQKNRWVESAQFNHIIQYRTIPNDSQFAEQWQYVNTGQSGGTANADLDADLAWDITTGGLTPFGDTIVVAVIDEGYDIPHSDLGDNAWLNHDEIPNNDMDDDGNGYIDDYLGWNAYNENDVFLGGWHGTPIAGIIGAQGNNGTGVAGVNWNVKLMLIEGGGTEAEALAAYAYCYNERQIYNQTLGQKGAFVVATNASWGTDGGQPEDAPIWCGFYDTLGEEGILSCGATTNSNTNVDVDGDLPTACPSDYLISVTNLDHNDEKVTAAGYGATTIDLGAYGTGTWTIADDNSYGTFAGTSAAAPHVAGTIALMYAAPCFDFAAQTQADPAAAALQIKNHILDGAVALPSLNGITVTGGKLNMFNAVKAIIDNCDANTCYPPYALSSQNISDISGDFSWAVGNNSEQTDIRYKETVASTWNVFPNVSPTYNITGLQACTDYELQTRSICGNETTDWSNSFPFKTDGCCIFPSGFQVENTLETQANLNWDFILASTSYTIRYRVFGNSTWEAINSNEESISINNLTPCTYYETQIQSSCSGGADTDFSPSIFFMTSGCPCIDNAYCMSNGGNSVTEWIAQVELNTLSNISENNALGYSDFLHYSTQLDLSETYTLMLTPGYSGSAFSEYFMVWIDYNQDGDFDDANENIFDPGSTTQEAISTTIHLPLDIPLGSTRMRISMRYQDPPNACSENFPYGEVEDYCVDITDTLMISTSEIIEPSLSLFPNPVTDVLQIKIPNVGNVILSQVQIVDVQGKVVEQKNNIPSNNFYWNTSAYSSGIYFIQITDEKGKEYLGKFIKQ